MIENILQTNSLKGEQAQLLSHLKSYHVDLASERVGGKTLKCSDDFFAPMDNLLKAGRGIFIEDKYTDRGKWMDGWESRRSYGRHFRQESALNYDWCEIKLGIAGRIRGFDIDTNYFRGNAPEYVQVEACYSRNDPDDKTQWSRVLAKTSVKPHSQNIFQIEDDTCYSHVRLIMHPDGGIARFRVYGDAVIDWDTFAKDEVIDLASIKNGAKALLVSDMFFSDKNNLIMPGRGKDMGDGWETKRRRDPGPDWSIIKLAARGNIHQVIIDTAHFKGNYPDSFKLEGMVSNNDMFEDNNDTSDWQTIIEKSYLNADSEHCFKNEIVCQKTQSFTHIKLSIYPDGGISRMRIFGTLDLTNQ